jgi:hypothetical protein
LSFTFRVTALMSVSSKLYSLGLNFVENGHM